MGALWLQLLCLRSTRAPSGWASQRPQHQVAGTAGAPLEAQRSRPRPKLCWGEGVLSASESPAMTSVFCVGRGTRPGFWHPVRWGARGALGAGALGRARSLLSLLLSFVTTREDRTKGKERSEMASQTEFAEPSGDCGEFSALNHVRQKCEAGDACRREGACPILERLVHIFSLCSLPLGLRGLGVRGLHRAKCHRGLLCSALELPAQGVFRTPRPLLSSQEG